MKTIETPRTVIDLSYEASDGQIFQRKDDCIRHENVLFYDSFILDKEKTKGALTKSNWQHYMYSFMQIFVLNPRRHAEYIQEEKFSEREYSTEKQEMINTGFKLANVKKFFVEAFLTNIDKERYRRMVEEKKRSQRHSLSSFGARESDALTYYEMEYKNVSLFTLIEFMFSSGLLTLKDVTKKRKSNNEDDFEEGGYEGYLTPANEYSFFWYCFHENDTDALDLAIKHLGVNLLEPLSDRRTSSYGGGTRNFQTDFITRLVSGSFDDSWGSKVPSVDDAKRVKWLEYILEKDVPVKLFKFVKAGSVETRDAEYFFSDKKKEHQIHFIHNSIEELIKEVENCGKDSQKYMFKKNHKRVIELLKTKVGKNFLEANKDNKKDKYYAFSEQVCEMVKDIFCEYPEKKLIEDSYRMFHLKMVVKENMSEKQPRSDHDRHAEELGFEFVLDVLKDKTKEKKTDVCSLYAFSTNGWATDKKTVVDEINLKDYLDKPDKLAMELAFHLNAGLPLGVSATEKIKEIDLRLFNIEKQKELLAKEEERLSEEKKKASLNICPKKKNK